MGRRGKVVPNITTIINNVKNGDRKTMWFRNRIWSKLIEEQKKYYLNADKKVRDALRVFVRGNVQAGAITEKESEFLSFWVSCWGETWDGKPVVLNTLWATDEVISDISEGTETKSLNKENKKLKERIAQLQGE